MNKMNKTKNSLKLKKIFKKNKKTIFKCLFLFSEDTT